MAVERTEFKKQIEKKLANANFGNLIPFIILWGVVFGYISYARSAAIKHLFLWESALVISILFVLAKLGELFLLSYFQYLWGLKNKADMRYVFFITINAIGITISTVVLMIALLMNILMGYQNRFMIGAAIFVAYFAPTVVAWRLGDRMDEDVRIRTTGAIFIPQVLWIVILIFMSA